MASSTRERILDTTAALFRKYGYTGTGLKEVVTNANAPFGSLYHHFPGGKEQLGTEVIHRSGQMYEDLVMAVFDGADNSIAGAGDVFAGAAEVLRQTDYIDACPIATVALEVASSNDTLRQATAEVFEGWIGAASARLVADGIPPARARELAIVFIELLEGAFLLSRAAQTTEAMDVAGAAVVDAIKAAKRRR
jgi:AcrR family transcriptional regulator